LGIVLKFKSLQKHILINFTSLENIKPYNNFEEIMLIKDITKFSNLSFTKPKAQIRLVFLLFLHINCLKKLLISKGIIIED